MIDHTRHIGIFSAERLSVCLIGAGGIGAITAITLGKMGIGSLTIYDDDIVDDVNLATQYHRLSDVGLSKAETVGAQVTAYSGLKPKVYVSRVTEDTEIPADANVYISAVDSIESRKGIWQALKYRLSLPDGKRRADWYLDARMGAEEFELFAVNLPRTNWYDTMSSREHDSDFPDLPCTSKATIYTANIAAGHIGAIVRSIATWDQEAGVLSHNIMTDKLNFMSV